MKGRCHILLVSLFLLAFCLFFSDAGQTRARQIRKRVSNDVQTRADGRSSSRQVDTKKLRRRKGLVANALRPAKPKRSAVP